MDNHRVLRLGRIFLRPTSPPLISLHLHLHLHLHNYNRNRNRNCNYRNIVIIHTH